MLDMDGYAAGTEGYEGNAAEGTGWYATDGSGQDATQTEQTGFSIPTTGQTNGGGPIRRGGSGARYNPMGRGKGSGDGGPASASTAEKNELGYIIFAYSIGYQTDESQLHALFAPYGTVAKVNVIQDFATGQGKGFGFVTMPNAAEAESAVNTLNGSDFNGNTLQVRFKSPKGQGQSSRGSRGSGFRGVRGGGGFRGRGGPRGGGGFRGGRGAPRGGGGRGRGRGAYSSAPSAYDGGYGGGYGGGYEQGYGGYDTSYGGGYDYSADPYGGSGGYGGTGYTSYGTGGW